MARTIIVVGGALSGPTAAARARETDESARILLLERNTRVSYALTGLSLYLSGEVKSLEDLNRERADFFASVYNVEVRTGHEVLSLDAGAKTILVRSGGKEETLSYDSLIYAAGAASLEPIGLPAVTNHSVFRTLDDLQKIHASLAAGRRHFTILGGGPMGVEAADGLIRAGADVTIVEKSPRILPGFSTLFSGLAAESLGRKARILCNLQEEKFEVEGSEIRAVMAGTERIETDFVISAMGVRPRNELLAKAGAQILEDASVLVDEYCRTTLPDVFACGVGVALPVRGKNLFLPQAAVADRSAQTAGANAAGGSVRMEQFAGAMLLRLPEQEIGRTGQTLTEAKQSGKNASRVLVHVMDREPYMPGAAPAILQLVFEKGSGRVLGLEAIGHSLARRLDAASVAIVSGLSVHELSGLDSAYHPSSGAVRDALMVAATVASQAERGLTRFVDPGELAASPGKYLILDAGKDARGSVHLHIPLEELRARVSEVRDALAKSGAEIVAALSETGRRGHLAERILTHHGIAAVNIQGGKRLFAGA
jgi:NADPH-dependent 2,4-dienoyl-CoA reductase/sulfur reductase-like enzyme